ncbi:MAG: hypothetical protein HC902_00025 [Calothrix sp. SM1_5_4]|nr:hypothetical protein [Calothrix sp. SM1_5_4]
MAAYDDHESAAGNIGMYQQGYVKEIAADRISLAMTESTCDDAEGLRIGNSDALIYYSRSGSSLRFDIEPIVPMKVRNIGDFLPRQSGMRSVN